MSERTIPGPMTDQIPARPRDLVVFAAIWFLIGVLCTFAALGVLNVL